jgi:hypothetical protein
LRRTRSSIDRMSSLLRLWMRTTCCRALKEDSTLKSRKWRNSIRPNSITSRNNKKTKWVSSIFWRKMSFSSFRIYWRALPMKRTNHLACSSRKRRQKSKPRRSSWKRRSNLLIRCMQRL